MTTPTSDQGTQHEFFSPRKLLNEAISIITRNFATLKFTNRTVYKNVCSFNFRVLSVIINEFIQTLCVYIIIHMLSCRLLVDNISTCIF